MSRATSVMIWSEICCTSYNVAFLPLCCFVLPSLSSGIVCVLGVRGWQEPDVDCLLLIFSLALLVAYPFSPAYRYRLVSLDWRALHLSKDYRREINSKSRQL